MQQVQSAKAEFKKMNTYRYNEPLPKLELDKKRFRVKFCPCGKSNKDGKFVPYLGHENKGYCHSCGDAFLPELPKVEERNTHKPKAYKPRPVTPQQKPVSFIPVEIFKASLQSYEVNHFVKFLIDLFGVEVASELVSRYFIGTSKHWNGATVFWQIDKQGKVRTGKIMLYGPTTGKRVKEPFNHINWVHKALKQPEFELRQCFFGEHLLAEKDKSGKLKPVALVESEKTAVIASVYLPNFTWVAAGSKDGLNMKKCQVLNGRDVLLFPDLNCFDDWNTKVNELKHIANFKVFGLLERKATEREKNLGLDLADYLLRFDVSQFPILHKDANIFISSCQDFKEGLQDSTYSISSQCINSKAVNWNSDIIQLEKYFAGLILTAAPIRLNSFTILSDTKTFINNHLTTVKENNGQKEFLPYLLRLKELRELLG